MAKKPDDRPKTWEEVITDIDLVLLGKFPGTKLPDIEKSAVIRKTPSKKTSLKKLQFKSSETEGSDKDLTVKIPKLMKEKHGIEKSIYHQFVSYAIVISLIIISVIAFLLLGDKDKKTPLKTKPIAVQSVQKPVPPTLPVNNDITHKIESATTPIPISSSIIKAKEETVQTSKLPSERVILDDILAEIGKTEINTHIRILEKMNKFRLLPAESPPSTTDFYAFRNSQKGTVFFIPANGKAYFHNQFPNKSEIENPELAVSLAKNQKTCSVVGIVPAEELGDAQLSISELKSETGKIFLGQNIKIYFVRHLMKHTEQFAFRPFPMGLQPLDAAVKLRKDIVYNFMLDISAPPDATAGTYSGKIKFNSGKTVLEKSFSLKILDFTLMRPEPERMNWGFYYFLKYSTPMDYEFMARFGINTLAVSAEIGSDYVGKIKAIRKAGINGILLLDVGQMENGITEKLYSKEWEMKYKENVSQFQKQMQEIGEGGKYIGMIHDEPRETMLNPWNRNYAQTMIYHKLVGEAAPMMSRGINTMTDGPVSKNHPDGLYAEFVKNFDMVMPHYWKLSSNIIRLAKENSKCSLWSYNDGDNRLAWGLHSWKAGLRGRTMYNYRSYTPDEHPLSPVYMASREFEGRSFTGNYVIAWKDKIWGTVMLVNMHEGIIDYRYVYTLEKLIEKVSEDKKAIAAEAEIYLEKLKTEVPEYAHSEKFTDGNDTGSGEVNTEIVTRLDSIRAKLAAYILKLSK